MMNSLTPQGINRFCLYPCLKNIMKKESINICIGLLALSVAGVEAETKPGLGISSWAGWKPGDISRADCPELRSVPLILKWGDLEPAPGKYDLRGCHRQKTRGRACG